MARWSQGTRKCVPSPTACENINLLVWEYDARKDYTWPLTPWKRSNITAWYPPGTSYILAWITAAAMLRGTGGAISLLLRIVGKEGWLPNLWDVPYAKDQACFGLHSLDDRWERELDALKEREQAMNCISFPKPSNKKCPRVGRPKLILRGWTVPKQNCPTLASCMVGSRSLKGGTL